MLPTILLGSLGVASLEESVKTLQAALKLLVRFGPVRSQSRSILGPVPCPCYALNLSAPAAAEWPGSMDSSHCTPGSSRDSGPRAGDSVASSPLPSSPVTRNAAPVSAVHGSG